MSGGGGRYYTGYMSISSIEYVVPCLRNELVTEHSKCVRGKEWESAEKRRIKNLAPHCNSSNRVISGTAPSTTL